MISIAKQAEPAVLVENCAEWTAEILRRVSEGVKVGKAVAGKYAHPQIKSALMEETSGKCAYCESKVEHIAYGDVEHIIAKSVDPSLSVTWTNLTIACDRCNQNKGDEEGLVDPYADDPAQCFVFLGPFVRPRPGNERADLTERVLKLNRVPLFERRLDRIDSALALLKLAEKTADINLRHLIKADALAMAGPTEEFSAVVSAALQAVDRP